MKVAIYIRKSREDREETRETTLERHERILKDYCNRYDLRYTEDSIYREVVSGDNIANRPQMQRLLQDVENCMYDGVVVIELQRLSRGNGIDQEIVKETFRKSGTLIYTLNKVYNLTSGDEIDEDMLELSLFLSRQELKAIKRRMIRGRKQAQKEGYYTPAVPPFGYIKERQGKGFVLVPHETEADIVKMMFNWYANEDIQIYKIRDYLNNNNIKTKRGNKWSNAMIRFVLKNKVYLGLINYDNLKEKKQYEGKHQALIDVETYEKAQIKFKDNMPKHKMGTTLRNPLANILKCSMCGKTLSLHYVPAKKNYNLQCDNMDCNNIGAYLHFVENKLIDELKEELKGFNYFLENTAAELNKKKKLQEKELQIIKNNIDKKKEMIERCCEMLEEGIYSKQRYLERVNTLEEEIDVLKRNYLSLSATQNSNEEEKIRRTIPILEKVLDEYWNLDPTNKNTLLKSIIEKIEYTKLKKKPRKAEIDDQFELKIYLKI